MTAAIQSAFILHSRPYRDSSLLLECITAEAGRISAVVKGVRGTSKSARLKRGQLQPFNPLLIDWTGKTDLKTIVHVEAAGPALNLQGERLYSALYINELLIRLLQPYDENPIWFVLYQQALHALQQTQWIDIELRQFELQLLEVMGYGLDLRYIHNEDVPIESGKIYAFDSERGLFSQDESPQLPESCYFAGDDLLAISQGDFSASARRAAKRLCRMALAPHIGDKPLKSRELFSKMVQKQ